MKRIGLALFLLGIVTACVNKPASTDDGQLGREEFNTPLEHTIMYNGETLALIARWYTGDAANWKAIAAQNPDLVPTKMRLGNKVFIPVQLLKTREPMPKNYVGKHEKAKEPTLTESAASAGAPEVGTSSVSSASSTSAESVTEDTNKAVTESISSVNELPAAAASDSLAPVVAEPQTAQASSAIGAVTTTPIEAPVVGPSEEELKKAKLLDELLE